MSLQEHFCFKTCLKIIFACALLSQASTMRQL